MQHVMAGQHGLDILEDIVVGILTHPKTSNEVCDSNASADAIAYGITTMSHGTITARAIVVTSGTSLRGRTYIGKEETKFKLCPKCRR